MSTGVVSSRDPALDCALAGFPRGILLQRAIKRIHFYERKIFCSKGKLRMCFCTQGPLMWMSVGVCLNHECIMIQRNAPCVCVCVCVWRICENGDGNSLLHSPTQDHCERSTPFKDKIIGLVRQTSSTCDINP